MPVAPSPRPDSATVRASSRRALHVHVSDVMEHISAPVGGLFSPTVASGFCEAGAGAAAEGSLFTSPPAVTTVRVVGAVGGGADAERNGGCDGGAMPLAAPTRATYTTPFRMDFGLCGGGMIIPPHLLTAAYTVRSGAVAAALPEAALIEPQLRLSDSDFEEGPQRRGVPIPLSLLSCEHTCEYNSRTRREWLRLATSVAVVDVETAAAVLRGASVWAVGVVATSVTNYAVGDVVAIVAPHPRLPRVGKRGGGGRGDVAEAGVVGNKQSASEEVGDALCSTPFSGGGTPRPNLGSIVPVDVASVVRCADRWAARCAKCQVASLCGQEEGVADAEADAEEEGCASAQHPLNDDGSDADECYMFVACGLWCGDRSRVLGPSNSKKKKKKRVGDGALGGGGCDEEGGGSSHAAPPCASFFDPRTKTWHVSLAYEATANNLAIFVPPTATPYGHPPGEAIPFLLGVGDVEASSPSPLSQTPPPLPQPQQVFLQNLSSMVPALLLTAPFHSSPSLLQQSLSSSPRLFLDACAAPGGKTSHLISRLSSLAAAATAASTAFPSSSSASLSSPWGCFDFRVFACERSATRAKSLVALLQRHFGTAAAAMAVMATAASGVSHGSEDNSVAQQQQPNSFAAAKAMRIAKRKEQLMLARQAAEGAEKSANSNNNSNTNQRATHTEGGGSADVQAKTAVAEEEVLSVASPPLCTVFAGTDVSEWLRYFSPSPPPVASDDDGCAPSANATATVAHNSASPPACSSSRQQQHQQYPFDGILLDPPCTGLGLRPRLAPHTTTLEQIGQAADYQRSLFRACVARLRASSRPSSTSFEGEGEGGSGHTTHSHDRLSRRIVYSTCTTSLAENEDNVIGLLQWHNRSLGNTPCVEGEGHITDGSGADVSALCGGTSRSRNRRRRLRICRPSCPSDWDFVRSPLGQQGLSGTLRREEMERLNNTGTATADDLTAPLMCFRFMPSPGGSSELDGVGFFVCVFEVVEE